MCATQVKPGAESKPASVSAKAGARAGGRRSFMAHASAAIAPGAMLPQAVSAQQATSPAASAKPVIQSPQGREFWPGGARLVISISMQFEAGGQPPKGTDSPFPKIDLPARIPADLAPQHLVCLRLSRGHSADAGPVGSPWCEGDIAHDW